MMRFFDCRYAAVYLAAGMENLLEELVIQCMPADNEAMLTATILEHAIANNGDLWGLLQPYAHLNAGRVASGALAMPRWDSMSSVNTESTHTSKNSNKSLQQSLVTTCVGSTDQLRQLVNKITTLQLHRQVISWSTNAINTLFYFMRCSQVSSSICPPWNFSEFVHFSAVGARRTPDSGIGL